MASSTKPYLLRAIYEWCTDNNLTPHVVVKVDASTQVPREFVRDEQIVLNVNYDAVGNFRLDNAYLSFQARFDGVARELIIPVGNVLAIYAKETGEGMHFEFEAASPAASSAGEAKPEGVSASAAPASPSRPAHLKLIK